jgi:hypothetical protein
MEHMTQVAPYPAELADLVRRCRYRAHEGWRVDLIDDCQRDKDRDGRVIGHGLTLSVLTKGYDAYHPENDRTYRVYHYFIVPAATYNRASWMRWLFDQFGHVEDHERMENFTLVDDSLTEPEDECTCGHAATRHDGRISQCLECGEQEHRYEAKQPRLARPFAPTHGPGDDPYVVHEYATAVQRRTRYTGKMLPERHL